MHLHFSEIHLLFVISLACHWRFGTAVCSSEDLTRISVWNVSIVSQLELNQLIENVNTCGDPMNFLYLSLAGGRDYELDIIKLMKISINGSLTIKSKGGSAGIKCMTNFAEAKEFRPLSRASLVFLDGLIFTGCPVPILIEDASNVVIQNCVFQHHEHGALSIFNSEKITVKNCTFFNNTSDGMYTRKQYLGSSGGLSIGYHHYVSKTVLNVVDILVISCNFTFNSIPSVKLSSTEALIRRLFPGRGGALSIVVNINSPLRFVLNDSVVMNNDATTFSGGVYCVTFRGSLNQTYMFANNIFMNNTGPKSSALSFINLLNRPVEFAVYGLIYNCTFVDNIARSEVGGAISVYPLYALANNIVIFENCKFYNNTAPIYGGAVDIISYNFFGNKETAFPIGFINCIFDGNRAPDGAAINAAHYGAKFDNVTFKNNRESTIRVIAAEMEFYGEVSFIDNMVDGSVGGAIYLISSSQMILHAGTHLKFINNTGRSGAAIVAEIRNSLSVFDKEFFNPLCFMQYYNSSVPFNEINHEVNMTFEGNNAIVGSAIYANLLGLCSWSSYYPPYFHNTSSVFRWPFISYENSAVDISKPVQTPAVDFTIQNETISAYPGEEIKLRIIPFDEQNFTATNMFEIRGSLIDYVRTLLSRLTIVSRETKKK